MIQDGLIPFSPNQQNAIWMLINAEYYRDAINLKIKNLTMNTHGIFIHDNQLFSSEELVYLIKLIQQPAADHPHLSLERRTGSPDQIDPAARSRSFTPEP